MHDLWSYERNSTSRENSVYVRPRPSFWMADWQKNAEHCHRQNNITSHDDNDNDDNDCIKAFLKQIWGLLMVIKVLACGALTVVKITADIFAPSALSPSQIFQICRRCMIVEGCKRRQKGGQQQQK